jgi:hypothetical protein
MEAVFCIAAAHLHHLHPSRDDYHVTELQHYAGAISGLRDILDQPLTCRNTDAMITCGFLLCLHGWTSVERNFPCVATDLQFGLDNLIPLTRGLKSIFMEMMGAKSEIWTKVAVYRPVIPIRACSDNTVFPAQLERSFEALYDKLWPHPRVSDHFELYMSECKRLIPVLSLLKLSRCGVGISPLQSDIVRYLFSFPILFSAGFVELLREGDKTGEIVLAHFYVAISGLVPEKFWWAQQRTKHMLAHLEAGFIIDALAAMELQVQ